MRLLQVGAVFVIACFAFCAEAKVASIGFTVDQGPSLFSLQSGTTSYFGAANIHSSSYATLAEYPVTIDVIGTAKNPEILVVPVPGKADITLRRARFKAGIGFVSDGHGGSMPNPQVQANGLTYFWYGLSLDGTVEATLSVTRGAMSGLLYGPDIRYWITPSNSGEVFRIIDTSVFDSISDADPVIASGAIAQAPVSQPSATGALSASASPSGMTAYSVTIKTMVLYTANALARAGSQSAMNAEIALGINQLNTALANSQVNRVQYVLAHSEQTTLDERAYGSFKDAGTRFDQYRRWVQADPGVASLRNTYNADEVQVIMDDRVNAPLGSLYGISYTQRHNCGITGYLPDILGCDVGPAYKAFALSVIDYSSFTVDYTFVHEVGHTLGGDHNPQQGAAPGQGAYLFNYGHYVDQVARDAISYATYCTGGNSSACPAKLIYSNPYLNFPGTSVPSGRLTQEGSNDPRYRYNAMAIDYLAQGVANFYEPTVADDTIFIDGMGDPF